MSRKPVILASPLTSRSVVAPPTITFPTVAIPDTSKLDSSVSPVIDKRSESVVGPVTVNAPPTFV